MISTCADPIVSDDRASPYAMQSPESPFQRIYNGVKKFLISWVCISTLDNNDKIWVVAESSKMQLMKMRMQLKEMLLSHNGMLRYSKIIIDFGLKTRFCFSGFVAISDNLFWKITVPTYSNRNRNNKKI